MPGANEHLLDAVCGLQRAAEAEFHGNNYYRVANQIADLTGILGANGAPIPGRTVATGNFESRLRDVRKAAEAALSGNQYYLAARRLEALASFLAPSSIETVPVAAPEPAAAKAAPAAAPEAVAALEPALAEAAPAGTLEAVAALEPAAVEAAPAVAAEAVAVPVQVVAEAAAPAPRVETAGPSFSQIAAAAKARVEDVSRPKVPFAELAAAARSRVEEAAATFAVAEASQPTAPLPAEAPETLFDGELERRSSEPCAMAELAPVEAVAATAVPAEAFADPEPAERAAPDLGSSAAESKPGAVPGACGATRAEACSEPAHQAAAPAYDRKAYSASQKVEMRAKAETKPKGRSTLFRLWLDLVFGKKK